VKKMEKKPKSKLKKNEKKQYKQRYGRTVGAIGGACGAVDVQWGGGGGRVLNNNQYPGCYSTFSIATSHQPGHFVLNSTSLAPLGK
jgi:hypothetical protein